MAAFMWMEGVPGRPDWDGWFEVASAQFGGQGVRGNSATSGHNQTNTLNVSRRTDASSPAIMQRCVRGNIGAASLWFSGENDVPLYQVDMTEAIVAGCSHTGSTEQLQLSFATATWRRATDS
jgi:type VI protein secretion system component Hcp